jgi:hypothetical protein
LTLVEALQDAERNDAIVGACVRLVEDEVASRRGLSGAALKAGFAAFQRLRPGIVRAAVARLLPELAVAIDPHWQRAVASGDPDGHFRRNAAAIASDLLAVTDRLSARATNRVALRIYKSLRASAGEHVAAAVPRLPDIVRPHVRS